MELMNQSGQYPEYGNLVMNPLDNNEDSKNVLAMSQWVVSGKNWNLEEIEKEVKKFLLKIRDNYRRAQSVIHQFSNFMPFIKLTAK